MTNQEFLDHAVRLVTNYTIEHADVSDNASFYPEDVYIVWSCKTLQNNKALLSTKRLDGMYYEVTYNGDKNEIYLDAYKKWDNLKIVFE